MIEYVMKAQKISAPTGIVYWSVLNTPDFVGTFSGFNPAELTSISVDYSITVPAVGDGTPAPPGIAGGDLGGTYPNPKVLQIQTTPVSSLTPNSGQSLIFDGYNWTPSTDFINQNLTTTGKVSSHEIVFPAISAPPLSSSGQGTIYFDTIQNKLLGSENGGNYTPIITDIAGAAGGDLSANYPNPTVSKINGATVPVAGSLLTGNVLKVSGSSTLTYGAINLAGGVNSVSGVLPAANQAAQTMGGDVSGTTAAATVTKLQGRAVVSTAPTDGDVLTYVGANSDWEPKPATGGGGGGSITYVAQGAIAANRAFVLVPNSLATVTLATTAALAAAGGVITGITHVSVSNGGSFSPQTEIPASVTGLGTDTRPYECAITSLGVPFRLKKTTTTFAYTGSESIAGIVGIDGSIFISPQGGGVVSATQDLRPSMWGMVRGDPPSDPTQLAAFLTANTAAWDAMVASLGTGSSQFLRRIAITDGKYHLYTGRVFTQNVYIYGNCGSNQTSAGLSGLYFHEEPGQPYKDAFMFLFGTVAQAAAGTGADDSTVEHLHIEHVFGGYLPGNTFPVMKLWYPGVSNTVGEIIADENDQRYMYRVITSGTTSTITRPQFGGYFRGARFTDGTVEYRVETYSGIYACCPMKIRDVSVKLFTTFAVTLEGNFGSPNPLNDDSVNDTSVDNMFIDGLDVNLCGGGVSNRGDDANGNRFTNINVHSSGFARFGSGSAAFVDQCESTTNVHQLYTQNGYGTGLKRLGLSKGGVFIGCASEDIIQGTPHMSGRGETIIGGAIAFGADASMLVLQPDNIMGLTVIDDKGSDSYKMLIDGRAQVNPQFFSWQPSFEGNPFKFTYDVTKGGVWYNQNVGHGNIYGYTTARSNNTTTGISFFTEGTGWFQVGSGEFVGDPAFGDRRFISWNAGLKQDLRIKEGCRDYGDIFTINTRGYPGQTYQEICSFVGFDFPNYPGAISGLVRHFLPTYSPGTKFNANAGYQYAITNAATLPATLSGVTFPTTITTEANSWVASTKYTDIDRVRPTFANLGVNTRYFQPYARNWRAKMSVYPDKLYQPSTSSGIFANIVYLKHVGINSYASAYYLKDPATNYLYEIVRAGIAGADAPGTPHDDVTHTIVAANPDGTGTQLSVELTLVNAEKSSLNAHFITADVHTANDKVNTIITSNANTLPTAITLANVLKASFNAHRSQTNIHAVNDTTNIVSAPDAVDGISLDVLLIALKTAINAHFVQIQSGTHVHGVAHYPIVPFVEINNYVSSDFNSAPGLRIRLAHPGIEVAIATWGAGQLVQLGDCRRPTSGPFVTWTFTVDFIDGYLASTTTAGPEPTWPANINTTFVDTAGIHWKVANVVTGTVEPFWNNSVGGNQFIYERDNLLWVNGPFKTSTTEPNWAAITTNGVIVSEIPQTDYPTLPVGIQDGMIVEWISKGIFPLSSTFQLAGGAEMTAIGFSNPLYASLGRSTIKGTRSIIVSGAVNVLMSDNSYELLKLTGTGGSITWSSAGGGGMGTLDQGTNVVAYNGWTVDIQNTCTGWVTIQNQSGGAIAYVPPGGGCRLKNDGANVYKIDSNISTSSVDITLQTESDFGDPATLTSGISRTRSLRPTGLINNTNTSVNRVVCSIALTNNAHFTIKVELCAKQSGAQSGSVSLVRRGVKNSGTVSLYGANATNDFSSDNFSSAFSGLSGTSFDIIANGTAGVDIVITQSSATATNWAPYVELIEAS